MEGSKESAKEGWRNDSHFTGTQVKEKMYDK